MNSGLESTPTRLTLAPAHEFIASKSLEAQTSDTQVLTDLQGLVDVLHGFLFKDGFFLELDSAEAEGWHSHLASYLQTVGCLREDAF